MKFLYIARCGIPNTAPGIRIYNIAKIIESLGHEVDFLCRQTNDTNNSTIVKYDNYMYYFEKKTSNSDIMKKIDLLKDLLFADKTYERLLTDIDISSYDGLIVYNDTIALTRKLLKMKKNMKFSLFADVTEWYEFGNGRGFLGSLISLLTNIRIKYYDHKLDGIIAISNYLYNYYIKNNKNTVFIPPVFYQKSDMNIELSDLNRIQISYAGSPGVKDLLMPVISAIKKINSTEELIRFNIIGIDNDYLMKKYYHKSGECGIVAYGRLENRKAKEIISRSDFTVLFRRPERYAKAGYSTKLAESLMLGVPVICNNIGGADIHIQNNYNGIKIDECSVESIEKVLMKITKMKKDDIFRMKNNAYLTGKKIYTPANYNASIENLLKNVGK